MKKTKKHAVIAFCFHGWAAHQMAPFAFMSTHGFLPINL
ncbi:hypothetical protein B4096_2102 [Heyndrickxia coagulans]|nr:hypothetical protein B4096_2102 [Heyndrickxia coagulans]